MIRKIQMILFAGLILLLSACGQKETITEQKEEQWPAADIVTSTAGIPVTEPELTIVPSATITAAATPTTMPAVELPIVNSVQIEAGTNLETADFFSSETDIPTEEGIFTVGKILAAEELQNAGAVYEIPVVYDGYEAAVEVRIIDTTAPEIYAEDMELYVGETVSYKRNVELTDNAEGEITIDIDNSRVNLNEPGEYTLVYTATDASGNSAVKEIRIMVKSVSDKQRDEEVDRLADEVIDSLITENMSKWDICYKLWNWCRTKIAWGYSDGDRTIYAGAYEGLHDRKGDCYAYYATFTLFMEKLGIETIEVRRIGGNSNHWWCLVNLGDGWYHCDPSPRKVGHTYKCFMQTDEQVQAYTDYYTDHTNYYVFDKELYPERETEIVFESTIP